MDGAGALQWVAIALAFVAVLVILRYGSRPRCELCRRRHHRRATELVPPPAAALAETPPVTVPAPTADAARDEPDIEIDLTAAWQPNGHDREPLGPDLVPISWRADRSGVRTVSNGRPQAPPLSVGPERDPAR